MMTTLASLFLAGVAAAAPAGSAVPVVRHEEPAPVRAAVRLETFDDLARLCGALQPAERVRAKGDAVERGEAEAAHETSRGAALKERYEAQIAATKLPFAPYDGPERRLSLQEPVQLPVADGAAVAHRGPRSRGRGGRGDGAADPGRAAARGARARDRLRAARRRDLRDRRARQEVHDPRGARLLALARRRRGARPRRRRGGAAARHRGAGRGPPGGRRRSDLGAARREEARAREGRRA